jgi:hypothetical protein
MEFSNLGSHCSVSWCRQKDFLPYKCEACHLTFCTEHRQFSNHSCRNEPRGTQVFRCPICNSAIDYRVGEDANLKWEEHMNLGRCQKQTLPSCPARGCKAKLGAANSVRCTTCRKQVCVSHRYPDKHPCRVR